MKHSSLPLLSLRRSLIWGALLGAGALSMPAISVGAGQAAIFLHFGSFESVPEADTRLQEIQNKHTGLLTGLNGAVREVQVRPGLKVFRAQAGPVSDRFQAQSICGQFASNGDECYIIETVVAQKPVQTQETELAQVAEDQVEGQAEKRATENTIAETIESPVTEAVSDASTALVDAGNNAAQAASDAASSAAQTLQAPVSSEASSINTLYDTVADEPRATQEVDVPEILASQKVRIPAIDTAKPVVPNGDIAASTTVRDPQTSKVLRTFGGTNNTASDVSALPIRVTKQAGEGVDIAAREASIETALEKARQNKPVVVPKTPEQIEETTEEAAWYETINPFSSNEDSLPIQNESELAQKQEDNGSFIDSLNPFSSDDDDAEVVPVSAVANAVKPAAEKAPVVSALSALPEAPTLPEVPAVPQSQSLPETKPVQATRAVTKPAVADVGVPPARQTILRDHGAAKAALNQPPPLANARLPKSPVSNIPAQRAPNVTATSSVPSVPRISAPVTRQSPLAVAPSDLPPPPLPNDDAARRAIAQDIMREPIETGQAVTQLQGGVSVPSQSASPRATGIAPPPPLKAKATPLAPAKENKTLQPIASIPAGVQPEPKVLAANELPPIPGGISIADAAKLTDWAEREAQAKAQQRASLAMGDNVAVEEATRVPLSEEALFEPLPPPPVLAQGAPVTVSAQNLPSQTSKTRTLWAHLSAFDSKQDALRFWRGFRNKNPDFPSVRVRVTSAFVSQRVGRDTVSLRVGPFGNVGFIEGLCEGDHVDDADLECRAVRDLGSANFARQSRLPQAAGISNGRYGSDTRGLAPASGIWVQLGSFKNEASANAQWDALKIAHKSSLRAMQANISSPATGSHSTPLYRLRTGPFVNQTAAQELCLRLKTSGTGCLVVAER